MGPQSPERYRAQNDPARAADQWAISRHRRFPTGRAESKLLDMPPRRYPPGQPEQQAIRSARFEVAMQEVEFRVCELGRAKSDGGIPTMSDMERSKSR